jgi:pectate lyase
MALLLVMCGGMAAFGLVGCTDGIVRVFRSAPGTGGAGVDGGGIDGPVEVGPPEAGSDVAPINCPATLVGYATMGGGTTGGGDAGTFTASTIEDLRAYAAMPGPAVVRVKGTIVLDTSVSQVEVSSDKTILPDKIGDGLTGNGFIVKDNIRNVIFRNLTLSKVRKPYDTISIQKASNVWVDHCDLSSDLIQPRDTYDGLVDITHASTNVTVSWNYFHDHYNTSLVGHTDSPNAEDVALTVTFHHNRFLRTPSGSPRARYGHVHVFNNHYDTVDTYGIASVSGATVVIERNFFDGVAVPIVTFYGDSTVDGTVRTFENGYNPAASSANSMISTNPTAWPVPYGYADAYDLYTSVPALVDTCSGVGKVP